MKVIIAGGRDFKDYNLLKFKCNYYLKNQEHIEVVSGCQRGADILGQKWANENNYQIIPFPADWKAHGKAAGPIRNELMARYADVLIAFWDCKSVGTSNMISIAKREGLPVKIVRY